MKYLLMSSAAAVALGGCSQGRAAGDDGDDDDVVDAAVVADGAAVADGAPARPDAAGDAAPPRIAKVLIVGIDGVRHDKLATLDLPALEGLAARGVASRTWLYAAPMAPTVSGPGWSTIATGVWPDKHRVLNNEFTGHDLAGHPDFLTLIERTRPALHTYAIADWTPVTEAGGPGPIFGNEVDVRITRDGDDEASWAAADVRITDEAAAYLRDQDPDAAFVYLGDPDVVAHGRGAGAAYLASIEASDRHLATLLAAIAARPTAAGEDWLVMVTTDHGHVDGGGHGGTSWQERQSFIVAAGGPIAAGALAVQPRNVDIVPTALAHLGIAVDPAWQLDGVVLGTPTVDPFDTVADRLQPATDEATVPASVLGWTHELPAGWAVDNSRMTSGGTTEWRGWSLTDEAFWTAAAGGQGREAFPRSRGVIAVADPDEWDDVGAPSARGTFESTLSSPPYPVTAGATVRLRFASHYLQSGAQKAEVLVAFDGGADQVVRRYGPEASDANRGGDVISQIETIAIAVPAGARAMVVRWRLRDAGNDWYWAIDDARVE